MEYEIEIEQIGESDERGYEKRTLIYKQRVDRLDIKAVIDAINPKEINRLGPH